MELKNKKSSRGVITSYQYMDHLGRFLHDLRSDHDIYRDADLAKILISRPHVENQFRGAREIQRVFRGD